MSEKAKRKPPPSGPATEFFYEDDDGKRADADLHNPILDDGDDEAARAVSRKVAERILGKKRGKKSTL